MTLPGRLGFAALLLLLWLPIPADAEDPDATHYFRSVEVKAGVNLSEVVCLGCSVRVAGIVSGDVVTVAGDIEISGRVEGDAIAAGGRVRLVPGGSVDGEAVAVGGIVSHEGAAPPRAGLESVPYVHFPGQRSLHPLGVLTVLGINCLAALTGGLILRARRLMNLADSIVVHPLSTILVGVVLMALWIALWTIDDAESRVAQIALLTAHVAFFVPLFCGCAGIAWLAGRLSFPRLPSPLKLIAGALIVSALLLIPIAGMFLLVTSIVVAFGASVASGLGQDAHWIGRRRPGRSAV